MDINISLIISLAVLAFSAVLGWKRKFLDGLLNIISCVLGVLVLAVLVKGVGSFLRASYTSVVIALILLILIRLIHRLANFLISTFKLVRYVPFGRLADKLLGAALGAVEGVFVLWLAFLLIVSIDALGAVKAQLIADTAKSALLSAIYNSNYLVLLLQQAL